MVSERRSRWLGYTVLGATCGLVIGVYAFVAQSGALESFTADPADTYYNLLVRGFRAGQLSLRKEPPPGLAQLPDPYNPAANAIYRPASNTMHDMSYYKGKLYLYFGATPALILFWPYAAVTGRYLFHRQAVAIFCALGFLVSVGLLCALWRRYFAEVSIWVVAACVLALGFATGVPVLLTLCDVYEVPISCGYMLTMLALGAVWCAMHEPEPRERRGWLAAASVTYGLAVGARPNLLFGAVILLVPVIQAWRDGRPMRFLLPAATFPIMIVGLGLMLYNALRFENPFEFGLRYELGPARMQLDKLRFFSVPYLWFNFRVYFLEPAHWSARFPFVHPIVVPPLPSGRGQIETPFGILTNMPLVWLALAVPLAWRSRPASEHFILRGFLVAVALVFGVCSLVLCLFRGANFRYEVDFLPALVLLAVVGILGLQRALAESGALATARPAWRSAACWGWGLLLAFTVAFNLLAGVENLAKAYCYRGSALARADKFQEAIGRYEQALRIMPDFAEAHCYIGNALLLELKFQEAIVHYEQALRINPDYADAHKNLGDALANGGKTEEAIAQYEQALRIKPDFIEAHNNLGFILRNAGRVQEAINHYEQALRINPTFADARLNLGVALEQDGRVQEAIRQYQEALRIDPDLNGAKIGLSRFPVLQ